MAARERLTIAEGLLRTLRSEPTRGVLDNARRLLESDGGTVSLTIGGFRPGSRPPKDEVKEVVAKLDAEVKRLTEFNTLAGTPAAPAAVKAPPKKVASKGRGGKPPVKPKTPQEVSDQGFEKLHPRSRTGEFAKKGDGTGNEGPSPMVQQLQARLGQLGIQIPTDGRFGGYTEQAVKTFQKKYGLEPTGKVDQATTETLRNPPPTTAAAANAEIENQVNPPKKTGARSASTGGASTASASGGGTAQGTHASGGATGATGASSAPLRGQQGGSLNVNDKNAVEAFQKGHGLKVDGIVGPETRKAMQGSKTTTRAKAQAKGGAKSKTNLGGDSLHKGRGMGTTSDKSVKDLQKILDTLGFQAGDAGADGRFGPDTEKAVKRLQRRYGLKADGIVGKQTKALLTRVAKRHAKNVANLDAKALATEDSGNAARADSKGLREGTLTFTSNAIEILEATTTGNPTATAGTGGYSYSWTQTAGGGPPPLPVYVPDTTISDGRPDRDAPQSFVIGDGAVSPVLNETVSIIGRARAARERLNEAILERMAATNGDRPSLLARERVLRERLSEVEAEARAAGIEESLFREALHPRDRLGHWREVFGAAKRMTASDRPKAMGGGFRVAKTDKKFVVVAPDGKASHVDTASQVADLVSLVAGDIAKPQARPGADSHEQAIRAAFPRKPHSDKPDDYFDMSIPGTKKIPMDKLTLSKPPSSQPKSVRTASERMETAIRGGMAKRKPISVRDNGDGTFTVLDGNATSGVALERGWSYIPALITERGKASR